MKPTRVALCLFGWLLCNACGAARATTADSFETAETSWRVIHRDCSYRLEEHRRTFDEAHTGSASEHVRITANQGAEVYLANRVSEARVIAELAPSLWIKADRAGFQLLVRVVLPRTVDPETDTPLTLFVGGDVYDQPSAWRELRIENLKQRLDQQVRILRQKRKGLRIDPLEAYIDHVVVNVHPGGGDANIWLDDLKLTGFATSSRTAQVVPAGYDVPSVDAASQGNVRLSAAPSVRFQGSMVMVGERPFFARIVEYNGESLAWLGSLGFNTIMMNVAPTRAQLEEATRLNLWLVVPVSAAESLGSTGVGGPRNPDMSRAGFGLGGQATDGLIPPSSRVLAFHAGAGLAARDALAVRKRANRVRTLGIEKPIVAEVDSGAGLLADEVDLVIHHRASIGTSNELSETGDWLESQRKLVRREQPFWVTIPIEPDAAQMEQLVLLGGDSIAQTDIVELDQMRLLAFHSIAVGARGLLFRVSGRLDGMDSSSQRRVAALRALNQELAAVEPWAAAGVAGGSVHSSDALLDVRLLKTDRARLLIATRVASDQQFVVAPCPAESTVAFDVGALPITDQAYRIQYGDVRPIYGRNAGTSLQCENVGLVTAILLTQDPLAVNHLSRTLGESRGTAAELRYKIVEQQLAATRGRLEQLNAVGQGVATADAAFGEADMYLQRARRLLQTGDRRSAWEFTDRAANRIRGIRQAAWRQTVLAFPSPVASPLCLSFETLPAHFALAQRGLRWGPNTLPAGDFEDLSHLIRSGWRHERDLPPGMHASVDLSANDARSGRSALRIQARSHGGGRAGDQWPVTITSAPIAVRYGRLVRITGWVNVPEEIVGSRDGLLIYDSMTGLPLAERITSTRGWREFTLYRGVPRDGALSVVIAMTGLGEAWIDDVTVTLSD